MKFANLTCETTEIYVSSTQPMPNVCIFTYSIEYLPGILYNANICENSTNMIVIEVGIKLRSSKIPFKFHSCDENCLHLLKISLSPSHTSHFVYECRLDRNIRKHAATSAKSDKVVLSDTQLIQQTNNII